MGSVGTVAEMLRKRGRRDGQGSNPLRSALLGVSLCIPIALPVFVIPRTGRPVFDGVVLAAYGCFVVALLILADRVLHRGVPRGPKETAHVRSRVLIMAIWFTCMFTFMQASEILISTGSWGATLLLRIAAATAGTTAVQFLVVLPLRRRLPAP